MYIIIIIPVLRTKAQRSAAAAVCTTAPMHIFPMRRDTTAQNQRVCIVCDLGIII